MGKQSASDSCCRLLESWTPIVVAAAAASNSIRLSYKGSDVTQERHGPERSGPLERGRACFDRHEWNDAFAERVPRVIGTHNGLPLLEGGQILDVANVIWCDAFIRASNG
jgi:hypothetical protein